MKFGIISCTGHPLLTQVIREVIAHGLEKDVVVFIDGKLSDKNSKIIHSRLLPSVPLQNLEDMDCKNIPFFTVANINSAETREVFRQKEISYLVNSGAQRTVVDETIKSVRGVLNVHPGGLPKYRGSSCIEWAIYNNDPIEFTAHLMNDKIDEGPIMHKYSMKVAPGESYELIRTKALFFQARGIARSIAGLKAKPISPSDLAPQGEGIFHKPIPQEKLLHVMAKLQRGDYSSPGEDI